ncbi:hypothetical protein FRC08_007626 [Ceratobasidium sp. 394]|nr:hypothetical protein FRC08_007626 [Ceratobasidium sp. 394]
MKGDGSGFGPYELKLLDYFNQTVALAQDDFKMLSPLPNVVFTCPLCEAVWLPWTNLIWTVLVAVGSTWTIIYFSVTVVVGQLESSYDSAYQNGIALGAYSSQCSPGLQMSDLPNTEGKPLLRS